jgi:hypothetical protein
MMDEIETPRKTGQRAVHHHQPAHVEKILNRAQ